MQSYRFLTRTKALFYCGQLPVYLLLMMIYVKMCEFQHIVERYPSNSRVAKYGLFQQGFGYTIQNGYQVSVLFDPF